MRFRFIFMGLIIPVVLIGLFVTDPDVAIISQLSFGGGFVATMLEISKAAIYIGMLHISFRGLFDYLDRYEYFKKALETSEGSGKALQAMGLWAIAIALIIAAVILKT